MQSIVYGNTTKKKQQEHSALLTITLVEDCEIKKDSQTDVTADPPQFNYHFYSVNFSVKVTLQVSK